VSSIVVDSQCTEATTIIVLFRLAKTAQKAQNNCYSNRIIESGVERLLTHVVRDVEAPEAYKLYQCSILK